MIHVVGLGPGDAASLAPRAFALLGDGRLPLFLRTERHPTLHSPALAPVLDARRDSVTAFDDEYERGASFEETYAAIVERLLAAAAGEGGGIVYAVPGHPLVGESTVAFLLPRARDRNLAVEIVPAPSFVDACLLAVGEAVVGNLAVVDALSLGTDDAPPPTPPPALLRADGPILLYQVHSRAAASGAKLALMRAGFPDDFTVRVIRAAGVPGEEWVTPTPLFELDRTDAHDHLTSVWVPALPPNRRRPGFDRLVDVMARLRAPDGCPWDREQTHASLRRYVIEETYEVVEAIDADDPDKLCEELGDLLLQVVFHAQLAAEEGLFDVDDVSAGITEKLIRRHPHVFGNVKVADAAEVLTNWQAIKATEKGNEARTSILDGIPASLPALMRALEVSKRAVRVGFEWPDTGSVLRKVDEELAELRTEIAAGAPSPRLADELGDLLFTVVNVARRLGIDPEEALREQIGKFGRRFRHIEARAAAGGRALDSLTLDEMEALWQEAKRDENGGGRSDNG
jgi:tetrapyrrole methylase family protein/MazG family protein